MRSLNCLSLVISIAGSFADTSLSNYGRFGAGSPSGGHSGGGHDTGSSSGHGNELNQYSGVLPPVTLGGDRGGNLNQYTGGGGTGTRGSGSAQGTKGGAGGAAAGASPEYFGANESDYYDDYSTNEGRNNNGGDYNDGGAGQGSLEDSIPGVPGTDYPIYAQIPETGFTCEGKVAGGYYADPEGECQVFHICAGGPGGELFNFNFLCPNGTIFNQEFFICDWWFNFDCAEAEDFYSKNDENAAAAQAVDEAAASGKTTDQGQGPRDQGNQGQQDRRNNQGPANNGDRASQSQQGYNSPTAPRRGGQGATGSGASNPRRGGSPSGGNNKLPARRPQPQTGYGAPNDEGLPPLASYANAF